MLEHDALRILWSMPGKKALLHVCRTSVTNCRSKHVAFFELLSLRGQVSAWTSFLSSSCAVRICGQPPPPRSCHGRTPSSCAEVGVQFQSRSSKFDALAPVGETPSLSKHVLLNGTCFPPVFKAIPSPSLTCGLKLAILTSGFCSN